MRPVARWPCDRVTVMSSLGHMSLPELTQIFPALSVIASDDGADDVSLVNQTIVEELLQDICLLDFGHHTAATANLGLWRSRGDHHAFAGGRLVDVGPLGEVVVARGVRAVRIEHHRPRAVVLPSAAKVGRKPAPMPGGKLRRA